jgi:hypothetical protein
VVSGQLQAPAALFLGKETSDPWDSFAFTCSNFAVFRDTTLCSVLNINSDCHLFHDNIFLDLFCLEDEGHMFLRNVGWLSTYQKMVLSITTSLRTSNLTYPPSMILGFWVRDLTHKPTHILIYQSFAHESGLTLVCAEYGYLKGSPSTNS